MKQMKPWTAMQTILLSLLFVWSTNSQIINNDVQTSSGPVRGSRITYRGNVLTQYLGVPYAKPPVGQLRFKKPEPVERRSQTYLANRMPPGCVQFIEFPYPWYDFEDGKSEDCLYLNIWVPRRLVSGRLNKFSVMFWIHGGGFTIGSIRKRVYEGQALAADGNVIVVTVNYRLGAFGFLTSGTDDAPGNAGMYDLVEALKWVNQNIAAFGGDPQRVTVFGQSAGSIAVGLFCLSPLTKGLFRRAIMMSGSPAYLLADNNTASIAESQRLAEKVGCAGDGNTIQNNPEEVVSCLRDVDALELAKALNLLNPTSARSFFPMYGDEFLPRNPRLEVIDGNFYNVDLLIGNVRDEGPYQITAAYPELFGFLGEKDPQINKSLGAEMIRKAFGAFSFADPEAVVQHYLGDLAEEDYDRVREQTYTASGDYINLCPTAYFAESYSRAGNDVHYYFFVHRPSTTPWADWMGVVHYEEVQFVFGLPVQAPRNYTTQESLLSSRMIKIWSDFAKSGTTGQILWPRYSRENPTYMELDTGLFTRYGRGPHRSNCDFFRGYFGFD